MDLGDSDREEAFRAEVRDWLLANVPETPLPSGDTAEGFALCRAFEEKLYAAGWAAVSWPPEYGGRGKSLVEWLIFEEEYYRAGAPQRVSQNGISLLAPTLFEFGTQEQKARILPAMARAREVWAQGWSEPGAGSDLSALRSRAVRDEQAGGFVLTGHKTWCSRGAFCDSLFGLFRTGAAEDRHRGLTYFLVSLRAPGVTVRPVRRLDGDEGFAEVFFDGVFVPDRDVLGGVNEGFRVAMATASAERGLSLRSPGRFLATASRLRALYQRVRHELPSDIAPLLRQEVIRAWMDAEAYRLYTQRTVTRLMTGGSLGAESSLNKIFWSEMDVRMHETALKLLGERAELCAGATDAVEDGAWMKGYEFALSGPIYAGTNEIQRNVVAERLLGLPRG